MPGWFQLKIEHCDSAHIESISELLEELGALSIMLTDKNDNPVLEPEPGTTPLWPEVIIQALFAQEHEAVIVKNMLEQQELPLACTLEALEDKDWERAWMDDFKPQHFGEKLWICPTWLPVPDPNAVNLMLDPGLAFGTGTHPTTTLCLTWLEKTSLTNQSIIDYGCGSGILALSAIKLGALKAFATDIDPQALEATKNNAALNNIEPSKLHIGLPETIQTPADILVANILLTPLIGLGKNFHTLLSEKGLLVVSGLLQEQIPTLIDEYKALFMHVHTDTLDGWGLVVFQRF